MRFALIGLVALLGCGFEPGGSGNGPDAAPDATTECGGACSASLFCDVRSGECVSCDRLYGPNQANLPDEVCESGVCDRTMGVCADGEDVAYVDSAAGSGGTCTREAPCLGINDAFANLGTRSVIFVAPGVARGKLDDVDSAVSARIYGYGVEWREAGAVELVNYSGALHVEGFDVNGLGDSAGRGGLTIVRGTLSLRRVISRSHSPTALSNGVGVTDGILTMDACRVTDNANHGIAISNSNFAIRNSVIDSNGANGVNITQSMVFSPTGSFVFNTIADHVGMNRTGLNCGGDLQGEYTVEGNFFVPGSPATSCDPLLDTLAINNSHVPNYVGGSGNIAEEPLFESGTWRISSAGPGVDIDALRTVARPLELDVAGRPRTSGTAPDIGAHELQQP